MPITFGSIGDIISLSLLIKDLVKSIDNSRGSSAEYQAVIRELWSLDHALLEVEALIRSSEQTAQLNVLNATVKQCAEQCRNCVTKFQEQVVKKFGKSLQPGGSGSFVRDAASKIRWQVSEKDDLAKFRAEINAHCLSINMLLTTTGITFAKISGETIKTSLKHSQSSYIKSSATQLSELTEIKSRLEENTAFVMETASQIKVLSSKFDIEYFRNLGTDILLFVQNIWKVNILTYKAVLSLQTSIPAQLERCWSQEPATLEDALGRVTPIHLEFLDSWDAFEAVLEVRFRELPGHRKIKQREYALRANSLGKDIGPSIALNRCFLPGQRIDMSMIFDDDSGSFSSCPGCHMVTSISENEIDTQMQCPSCQMWYQRVIEMNPPESTSTTAQDTPLSTSSSRKRQWVNNDEPDDTPAHFRRVRLRSDREFPNQLNYGNEIEFVRGAPVSSSKHKKKHSIESRMEADSNDEDSIMDDVIINADTPQTSLAASDSQYPSEESTRASTQTDSRAEDGAINNFAFKPLEHDDIADDITMKDLGQIPPDGFNSSQVISWPLNSSTWQSILEAVDYDAEPQNFEELVRTEL